MPGFFLFLADCNLIITLKKQSGTVNLSRLYIQQKRRVKRSFKLWQLVPRMKNNFDGFAGFG